MALMPAVYEYDRYAELCNDLAVVGHPAELHGHLVGRLAAGTRLDHASWLRVAQELLDGRAGLAEPGKVMLIQLHDATLAQLTDSGFEITLLLPEDDAPIALRSQALGQWCNGFLGGFGLVERETELSEEANGVLHDFAAIAQIQAEAEDSEANESDYMEVMEYVRMATLMLFSECQPADKGQPEPPAALH